MSVKGRDKEFRIPKTTYVDFKHIEMDRVLTMLFPRLKYDGYGSRLRRGKILTVDDFYDEFCELSDFFKGFRKHESVAKKWIETDLLDLVNRGKQGQEVAAPRPLHGNTYKFRNSKYARDYGAAEHIYWMLYFARRGKGQAARDALKHFFFQGYDFNTDRYDQSDLYDVETQALMRLDHQVTIDTKDSDGGERYEPLCIGQADILADDILRLMVYENHVPRSVFIEYLKILLSFHLALYHLRLIQMLPKMVSRRSLFSDCSIKACPVAKNDKITMSDCPHRLGIIVDLGEDPRSHMASLATRNAEQFYRLIPAFVYANFQVKKLDEFATYAHKQRNSISPKRDHFTVSELIQLLDKKYESHREPYFKARLATLLENLGDGDLPPEVQHVINQQLSDFDTFIEIIYAYRAKYHQGMIVKCLDSLMQKNTSAGMLAQTRQKGSPRRFVLGSKLLEVLLQLAVLTQENGRFATREVRIEELLAFLRERYGLFIDRLPEFMQNSGSILDRRALRLNLEAFKRRLREIGFYEDLSDAYVTQKVKPRYAITITSQGRSSRGGRQV